MKIYTHILKKAKKCKYKKDGENLKEKKVQLEIIECLKYIDQIQ